LKGDGRTGARCYLGRRKWADEDERVKRSKSIIAYYFILWGKCYMNPSIHHFIILQSGDEGKQPRLRIFGMGLEGLREDERMGRE